ncbi:hypothetical protein A4X03_0g7126 [Tilletia caries]|uniref:Protein kinase domain-containing protein n=3 Tax=Tilletia TaxID=13289 RepID=A0A8T8SUX4_9BASI|nr:hypothetical protein A4X03_0g7126 [Tilletia caries]
MHPEKVKDLQAISFRERWPTDAVYDKFDVESYLFGTDQSPGSRAAQAFLARPPPKDGAEERGTGPLGPAMEFRFLQLTRQYLLRQNADEATIQHIAPFLVPCLAAMLYRHLRQEREQYDDKVLVNPEAIVYGRIRLPLSKAVLPVLSKIDKLENEVRVLRLGLQDATEQGRKRELQLTAAVHHSETLQAEAAGREEDLKRSQGTVAELRSTLDGLQRQVLDSHVQLQDSKRRAAEDLHQARTEAAQERMESDVAVADLQKAWTWRNPPRRSWKQRGEIARLRSSLAQLNHAARSSDAMEIDTETKQAQPPTGSQVRKSDSDRIEELERLLEEARAENQRLEQERNDTIEERDDLQFVVEDRDRQLGCYATSHPQLEASLKAAQDELVRQRKIVNGLEDELEKLRSYPNATYAHDREWDRLRADYKKTCVDKKQLEDQVDNLRGILGRMEGDLETLRSQKGPPKEIWMEELWRKGNGRYNFTGTDLGRGVHGVVEHAVDTLNRRNVAIKVTRCQPSGRPSTSAVREVLFMAKQRSVNVMSLLDVVYMESTGQHHAELWLVMDYMPSNLRAIIYDHNRRPTVGAIKFYVQEIAAGLGYLHRKGIHHGDLKPENVLVGQNNDIKIADFGLSEEVTNNPSSRRVFCSLNYRAPEILFRTNRRTVAADVWSLGVIVTEFLAGNVPWNSDQPLVVMEKILNYTGCEGEVFPGAEALPGVFEGDDSMSEGDPPPPGVVRFEPRRAVQLPLRYDLYTCKDVCLVRDSCLKLDPATRTGATCVAGAFRYHVHGTVPVATLGELPNVHAF